MITRPFEAQCGFTRDTPLPDIVDSPNGYLVTPPLAERLQSEGDVAFEPARTLWTDDQSGVPRDYALMYPKTQIVVRNEDRWSVPVLDDRLFWCRSEAYLHPELFESLDADFTGFGPARPRQVDESIQWTRRPVRVTFVTLTDDERNELRLEAVDEANRWGRLSSIMDGLRMRAEAGVWADVEAYGRDQCAALAPDVLDDIAGVRLAKLEDALARHLKKMVKRAHKLECPAIYIEWDIDNDWSTGIFACSSYSTSTDEWASDVADEVQVGTCPAMTNIYAAGDSFAESPAAVGRDGYQTARTLAMIGRVLDRTDVGGLEIGADYHDGGKIFHLATHRD